MSKIVLATFGSLGDPHPKIAIALELKERGHDPARGTRGPSRRCRLTS